MFNTTITNTTWTQVHDGQSLANLYCTAAIRLAQTNSSPPTANIAFWPAATPLYLPIGQRATFVSTVTGNATVDVVRNLQ